MDQNWQTDKSEHEEKEVRINTTKKQKNIGFNKSSGDPFLFLILHFPLLLLSLSLFSSKLDFFYFILTHEIFRKLKRIFVGAGARKMCWPFITLYFLTATKSTMYTSNTRKQHNAKQQYTPSLIFFFHSRLNSIQVTKSKKRHSTTTTITKKYIIIE